MDLKQEFQTRAQVFNEALNEFLETKKPEKLYKAAYHLPLAGGKRLRPVIAMVACESISKSYKDIIPFAIALEVTHNFTLVHDDIMDKSTLRRNTPTVHVEYGEPTAILAGDLLFAKAFECMTQYKEVLQVWSTLNQLLIGGIIDVCEGQQLDMNFESRSIVSRDEYIEMIGKKTAALFMIAAEGGAVAARASPPVQEALRRYGFELGLAFQIRDDVLDMSSTTQTLGKDIGNDIRNGKKTLIAVHALEHATGENKKVLCDYFGNLDATDAQVHDVYEVFKELGSLKYARDTANQYGFNAKESLQSIIDSPAKNILLTLADYAITRKK